METPTADYFDYAEAAQPRPVPEGISGLAIAEVEDCHLRHTLRRRLRQAGIESVADIGRLSVDDVLMFRDCGPASVRQIRGLARRFGLDLRGSPEQLASPYYQPT